VKIPNTVEEKHIVSLVIVLIMNLLKPKVFYINYHNVVNIGRIRHFKEAMIKYMYEFLF